MIRQTGSIRILSAIGVVAAVLTGGNNAYADVSSWLSLGTGAGHLHGFGANGEFAQSLRLATGMGTAPSHNWIIGGVARSETYFGYGTDLSLSVRIADHGFVNGGWGFAIDAGPLARFWGKNCYGGTLALTAGGPWGLEVGLQTVQWRGEIETYGAFVALDLARLTVYRRSGTSYWKNSFPAYRTAEEEQH